VLEIINVGSVNLNDKGLIEKRSLCAGNALG
jgi:hypothetical protein